MEDRPGAATAISLKKIRPSLSVALVERSSYDGIRIGEAVPPAIRNVLEQLGVWRQFNDELHLPAHGVSSAWGTEELSDHEFLLHPQREGWHLDRVRFDRMLAREAAALGVSFHMGVPQINHWTIQDGSDAFDLLFPGQGTVTLAARFVVDATGRQAWFARRQRARPVVIDRLAGFSRIHCFAPGGAPENSYVMVESCEQGWWYSALLPGARMVVTYMTDSDLARRARAKSPDSWQALLNDTRHIKKRLAEAGAIPAGDIKPWIACSQCLDRTVGPRWLAVGDAACAFDPLSAQGILKALHSGLFASYAISDFFEGVPVGLERYSALVERDFDVYLEVRASFYGEERRWPASPFWKQRQQAVLLGPETLLASAAGVGAPCHTAQLDFSSANLDFVISYCRTPRPVYQVASALRERVRSTISDRRLILALQRLCETGRLVKTPFSNPVQA